MFNLLACAELGKWRAAVPQPVGRGGGRGWHREGLRGLRQHHQQAGAGCLSIEKASPWAIMWRSQLQC